DYYCWLYFGGVQVF
nr:immunoglobulin light chain junction region [Macaca mulatta]